MEYDDNTLKNLMTLVDEHKGDVTEGEYIKMCNLLKDVHELNALFSNNAFKNVMYQAIRNHCPLQQSTSS